MIYLYDSTITNFIYNGKPLPNAYQVKVAYTINGEFYVTGRHPLDEREVYKQIIEDKIVKAHTPQGMQPFRIVQIDKHKGYVEFEAWPLFLADMRDKTIKPLSLKSLNGQLALNAFKQNLTLATPFEFTSDILDAHEYNTQDADEKANNPNQLYNALDIFKDIVSSWNAEVIIDGYIVRLQDRIGIDTEALLYEKKNINEFVDEKSLNGIVTRLHGKAEWTEEPVGGAEGVKRSLQVSVDSPLINNYSGIIYERQYTNNDCRTEQELINWLNLKFTTENIDKPRRSIEVGTNIINGTTVNVGDKLVLKYIKHDVDMTIRVIGYEYDGFANKYIKIILGEARETVSDTIKAVVSNVAKPFELKSNIAIVSANGKNANYYGPDEMIGDFKINDLWYKPVGNGEIELYRWNGTIWKLEKVSAGLLAGTLDADVENGDVDIINLNANNITANATNFVQSNWNAVAGGAVNIDGNGILTTAPNGSQTYIQNGIVGTRNPTGASIGQIGYVDMNGSPVYTISATLGSHFLIRHHKGDGFFSDTFDLRAGGETGFLRTEKFFFTGGQFYIGEYQHYISGAADQRLSISGKESIALRASEQTVFAVSNNGTTNYAAMYANLDMQGNQVTNQSDFRLKKNIVTSQINVLPHYEAMRFVEHEWIDKNKPKGVHFGVVAQETPLLNVYDEEHDVWSISSSKQIMYNSKAIQELIAENKAVKKELSDLKEILTTKGVI